MTLIEKLAPYLPYKLKLWDFEKSKTKIMHCTQVSLPGVEPERYKPILRPMSDLFESDFLYLVNDHSTDYFSDTDNYNEVKRYIDGNIFHHYTEFLPYGLINWLIKNHYDVFGMIESGEAIDINTLNK